MDRWDPFRDLREMQQAMDRLWRAGAPSEEAGAWAPRLDVIEAPQEYRVRLALPGVKPEDVQIHAEQTMLTVSGEVRPEAPPSGGRYLHQEHDAGRFSRSVSLPAGVDAERASARFADGVLTITLPKQEAARRRTIPIQGAGRAGEPGQIVQGEARGAPPTS